MAFQEGRWYFCSFASLRSATDALPQCLSETTIYAFGLQRSEAVLAEWQFRGRVVFRCPTSGRPEFWLACLSVCLYHPNYGENNNSSLPSITKDKCKWIFCNWPLESQNWGVSISKFVGLVRFPNLWISFYCNDVLRLQSSSFYLLLVSLYLWKINIQYIVPHLDIFVTSVHKD